MRDRRRAATAFVGVAAVAALLFVLVPSALSSGNDEYTASIAPTSVVAGTTGTQYTLTITNSATSTNDLGSANITVPAGYANITVGTAAAPALKSWSATDNSGVIELRAASGTDALAPGEAVSVPVTADAPGSTGSTTWATAADQSIDFSNTGAFTLVGSDPIVRVTGPLDHFVVTQGALSQAAGTPFDVTVIAVDSDGTTVGSYTGTVQFSSTDTGVSTVLPGNYTFTSGDQGVHTFTDGVTLTTAGAQTISVADNTADTSGTSPSITVAPGALDHFGWGPQPGASQAAGTAFSQTVTVTAYDAYANVAMNYNATPATFGGLSQSPSGCASDHTTATAGGAFGCDPIYGFTWNSGVATSSTVTDYTAESTQLTVTDPSTNPGGTVSASSSGFTVAPAGLDHFSFATVTGQTAGTGFPITVTARDPYGNQQPYGGNATVGGLADAPNGTPPTYPNPLNFSGGVASRNVKAFFANDPSSATDNSQLSVSGGGKSGSSSTFKVAPAGLDHFTFATVGNQVAGAQFGVTVTGRDQYANTEYDFAGSGTVSGLANSPAPVNQPPVYPSLSFTAGVASGNVKAFFANNPNTASDTSQLSINGGGKSGSSNTFKVQAADPATLTFTQQPNDTQPNPPSCSNPAVCVIQTKVRNLDQYSNPEVGVTVNVKINPANNPGSDTLRALTAGECTAGTCSQPADNSGVATFLDLTLHNIATDYKLLASSGPTVSPPGPPTATQVSGFFNVAQTVTKCNGNCTAKAQDNFDNITATASGLAGNLSIALENKTVPNSSTCGITNQVGNLVTVNPTNPTSAPTLEVTGTLLHKNNKGGVGNTLFCKDSGPGTQFHLVPACSQTKPKNTPPCLVKLSGNGQGDIFFDLIVKATFNPVTQTWTLDPKMGGGT